MKKQLWPTPITKSDGWWDSCGEGLHKVTIPVYAKWNQGNNW